MLRIVTHCAILVLCLTGSMQVLAQAPVTEDYVEFRDGRTLEGDVALFSNEEVVRVIYDGARYQLKDVQALRIGDTHYRTLGLAPKATVRDTVNRYGQETKVEVQPTSLEYHLLKRHEEGRIDWYAPYKAKNPRSPYAYFAKGGGLLMKTNYGNLYSAVRDHPRSRSLMTSSRYWRLSRNGLLTVGVGGFIIGLGQNVNAVARPSGSEGLKIYPSMIIGAGALIGAAISHRFVKSKFRQAAEAYNEGHRR